MIPFRVSCCSYKELSPRPPPLHTVHHLQLSMRLLNPSKMHLPGDIRDSTKSTLGVGDHDDDASIASGITGTFSFGSTGFELIASDPCFCEQSKRFLYSHDSVQMAQSFRYDSVGFAWARSFRRSHSSGWYPSASCYWWIVVHPSKYRCESSVDSNDF